MEKDRDQWRRKTNDHNLLDDLEFEKQKQKC